MEKLYGFGLPADISTHGAAIDQLIWIVHIFMFVIFMGWFIFFLYSLVRFRSRPGHKAEYHTRHFKATTYLEVFVAIFEALLLVGFSFPILQHVRNEMPAKDKSMEVRIVAEQFAWNIHYPGPDGKFGRSKPELMNPSNPLGLDPSDPASADDITTINQFHIPIHKPVIVHLTSKDVIHSFFLPVMRVKQDIIPGQEIPVWFEAKKTGDFEIACAQLCGLGHYRMRGFFSVQTQGDFDKWLTSLAPKPPEAPAAVPTPTPPPAAAAAVS